MITDTNYPPTISNNYYVQRKLAKFIFFMQFYGHGSLLKWHHLVLTIYKASISKLGRADVEPVGPVVIEKLKTLIKQIYLLKDYSPFSSVIEKHQQFLS